MAVGFYIGSVLKLSVSTRTLESLDSTQSNLRAKTGRDVDLYSTTTLSPEHAKLWRDSLRSFASTKPVDLKLKETCVAIADILDEAIAGHQTVLVEGE